MRIFSGPTNTSQFHEVERELGYSGRQYDEVRANMRNVGKEPWHEGWVAFGVLCVELFFKQMYLGDDVTISLSDLILPLVAFVF